MQLNVIHSQEEQKFTHNCDVGKTKFIFDNTTIMTVKSYSFLTTASPTRGSGKLCSHHW